MNQPHTMYSEPATVGRIVHVAGPSDHCYAGLVIAGGDRPTIQVFPPPGHGRMPDSQFPFSDSTSPAMGTYHWPRAGPFHQ